MALTFPRAFPLDGCFTGACSFDLMHQQAMSLTGGAQPNVASMGPSYWMASYSTEPLSRDHFAQWVAWLDSLRGGLRTFRGRPALWKWPQNYPRGFSAIGFDGIGNLSAIGSLRDTITVNEMTNGMILKAGDFLSIPVAARQHLHRIVEGGTVASGSVTLGVEPTIRPNATTGVAVLFEAPYCEMVLVGKPSVSREGTRGGSISFAAQQVLI